MGTATWKWEGEQVVGISLGTDAYDLADQRPKILAHKISEDWISIHNRLEDIEWADGKVHWLFEHASIPCPDIVIE